MNDWVKHAETKLAVTIAVAGVLGGVLFNLVKDRSERGVLFDAAAVATSIGVLLAGGSAMIGLFPRVRPKREVHGSPNPLYFRDITEAYQDASAYTATLQESSKTVDDMMRHLATQIYANASVAQEKYRWANRAIISLLIALVSLAFLAMLIAVKGA